MAIIILPWTLIILLFVFSIIGVIVPFIPDTILLWAGFLIYHFLGMGTGLPVSFWAAMVILTLLILSADFLMNAYFVKKYGGSKLAIIGAAVGLIMGTILLGPIGIVIGPFVLAFAIAFLEKKESNQAFKIGLATTFAVFSSAGAKIILQIVMIIWFFIAVV